MNANFGVFYTCYTETHAVDFSLEVLRKIYPECPIYLVSDGGSDYSFLNSKFDRIKTLKEHDSRVFIPFLFQETYKNDDNQSLIKNSIITFLNRIKSAIEFCRTEYMLVMEPDVLVRGKISVQPGAHLLGSRINEGLSSELRNIVSSVNGAIDVNTWGATPALFRSDSFMKSYEIIMKNDLLDKLSLADHRLANYDVLFAVMFALAGYEETFNPEIIECFRNPYWKYTNHPLVHQFRDHYPKKKDGYEGFHTRHEHGLGDKIA